MPAFSANSASRSDVSSRNTSWLTVLMAIAAGALAAFQVGKVHIALPSIRQSFSLGLVSASWIFSALNIVGLFAATPTGTLSARIGNKRTVVIGLLLIALASAFGALAPSLIWLLISRLVEGIGFMAVVVAAPSLIVEVTGPRNLRLALAGWATYMPGGIALMTVLAPLVLSHHTWRAVWWLNALLLSVMAVVLTLLGKKGPSSTAKSRHHHPWNELGQVLTARGPVFLAAIFGMYTMQHLSVMGFMPTLLHDRFHIAGGRMAVLVSIAMASNIVGNLTAGFLLQRGVPRAWMIASTSIFMAGMTVAMFALQLPFPVFYVCAFLFSCVGGIIPSAVMGGAPFHTPTPDLLGATNGLLVQGSNLGIVAGPPLMSLIVTHLGWSWVPVMTCAAALSTVALAINMRGNTYSIPEYFPSSLDE